MTPILQYILTWSQSFWEQLRAFFEVTPLAVHGVTDDFTQRAVVVDAPSSTLSYVGTADPGTLTSSGSWRILRITYAGTVTTIHWADGNDNFDNVWDDRAGLTYS
jgi:poly(3-hydroxybutyrate) depolymerase